MPPTTAAPQPLIVLAKDAYPKLRKFFVFVLVAALSLSVLIPSVAIKAGILSSLGITLLFLLFDIYNQLHVRLSAIEACVALPTPPYFDDYRAAEDEIYKSIETVLIESPGVDLQFLTVSGHYSWPFFEDAVRRLNHKFGDTKKIVVTFCLVEPSHFDKWSLANWKRKAQATLGSIEAFKRQNATRIEKQQIIIDTFLFDNVPHWHGLLINGSVLFLGRTEWIFYPEENKEPPDLHVGQIEYRKFHSSDRFGGDKRISRFKNWIDRYRLRQRELNDHKYLPQDSERESK